MSRSSQVKTLEEFGDTLLAKRYIWQWNIIEDGSWGNTLRILLRPVGPARDSHLSLHRVQRLMAMEAEDVPLELVKEEYEPVRKYLEDKMNAT